MTIVFSMRNWRIVSTIILLIFLVGCHANHPGGAGASAGPSTVPSASDADYPLSPAKPMLRTELFFVLSKQDGSEISDADWQTFVNDTITHYFPDGFTILDGVGQWKDSAGKIVHEHSKVLVVLHQRSDGSMAKLDLIREVYMRRFGQESVIRDSEKVWGVF
jgi:hypothetical protein